MKNLFLVYILIFAIIIFFFKKQILDVVGVKTIDNDINNLHPAIKNKVLLFFADVNKTLGYNLKIVEGYRSIKRQSELYEQGRSLPGKKVSNAKGGSSYHNYGLAIDIFDAKLGYNINYEKIHPIGLKYGFNNGSAWNDKGHFEYRAGKTVNQLLAMVELQKTDYPNLT